MARSYSLEVPPSPASNIDFAAELNEQQLAAVTSDAGPALVIAGAGSGKTRTLTYRVAWLLSQGVPPSSILLLTFTNKDARQMLDRVRSLVPAAGEGVWGGTFHSIGNRILRRHAEAIGFRQGFTIMDREDQEAMVAGIIAREGLGGTDKRFPKAGVLADIFSFAINTGASIPKIVLDKYPYFISFSEIIERVQTAYEGRKKDSNALDFDDLLSKVLELFLTSEDVAKHYQQQFRHVLVDEYQDTNRLQAELVDVLSAKHKSLMVVGDDAQSIYSWRGANFENIMDFPKHHAGAKVFKIETNYRSVPEILNLANAAILSNDRQFPKTLEASRASYPVRPALVALATNSQQASFVAQRILELREQGIELAEMAVLYRAHYHSLEIQLELTRRGIPFALTSGLRFFEQAHIKDVSAFLKFSLNPRDEVAFKRMVLLLPGIGNKTSETIWNQTIAVLDGTRDFSRLLPIKVPTKSTKVWDQFVRTLCDLVPASGDLPPSAMIQAVLFAVYDDYMKSKFSNFEARHEDLITLAGFSSQFETTEEFLSQLALLGGIEIAESFSGSPETEKITLSSLHQAKGLEWRVVFLIWLADGMFPSSRSLDTKEGIEEERRLFYVGITRCKDELYLSYPEMRLGAGYGEVFQRPSRFLHEIPEDLFEAWDVSTSPPRAGDEPF